MVVPVFLFWDYVSSFPWYIGTVLLITGMVFLWATRYTARFYPKWGNRYYIFSAIFRPSGILLIAWGWLEIFSVRPPIPGILNARGYLFEAIVLASIAAALYDRILRGYAVYLFIVTFGFFIATTFGLGGALIGPIFITLPTIVIAAGWSVAAIIKLGVRRSLLFARNDDPLVTDGVYALHRHPQLIAAGILVLMSMGLLSTNYNDAILDFISINFLIFAAGLYLVTIGEERDLLKRFGDQYVEYSRSVPRFAAIGPKTRSIKHGRITLSVILLFLLIMTLFLSINMTDMGDTIYLKAIQPYRRWEARSYLSSIATAQISYYAENEAWGSTFAQIGWDTESGNKLAYFMNSCEEVAPASNGSSECPEELADYFLKNPPDEQSGFHAAGVWQPGRENEFKMEIWVVDSEKNPRLFMTKELEIPDADLRALKLRRGRN